jgi:hypothetical protein
MLGFHADVLHIARVGAHIFGVINSPLRFLINAQTYASSLSFILARIADNYGIAATHVKAAMAIYRSCFLKGAKHLVRLPARFCSPHTSTAKSRAERSIMNGYYCPQTGIRIAAKHNFFVAESIELVKNTIG